jgi:oxygen-dependent protoporphyrinogen oxidase
MSGIGALGLHAPPPPYEESVKEFIYRHLGEAVYKKIIDPFVSGVYAGDPAELSMKAAFYKIFRLETELGSTPSILEGGLLRQVELAKEKKMFFDPELPTYKGGALGSFKEGLLALPRAVQRSLGDKVKLGWKVESVTKEGDMYMTIFSTPEGTKRVASKTVAVTAPAHATSKLLGAMMPEAAALDNIKYPTVASVTLAYPKDALKDDVRRERAGLGMRLFGFGNLIPRSMNVRTLGTIWSSSLFPYRVPEGYEMMLSYIGGAQDPKKYSPAIAELSEEQIANIVHGDISTILLKDNAPQPKILGVRKVPAPCPASSQPPLLPLLLSCPPERLNGWLLVCLCVSWCLSVDWAVDQRVANVLLTCC